MDCVALFNGVLDPGERLVWSYQPRQRSNHPQLRFAIVAFLPWLGSLTLIWDVFGNGARPLPSGLRALLLCVAGYFFALPLLLNAWSRRWAQHTAYALTSQRLLMAVGPRREDVRAIALTALGRVQMVNNQGVGKSLLLSARLPRKSFFGPRSEWTIPATGKIDTWASPYWRVDDPPSVQEMLENARNAIWYPPVVSAD
jgi:hypothetical protein